MKLAGQGEVELHDLTKRYGAVVAVDGVALRIPDGSFFSLLGPSGCGKTTILRLIGGFETPDNGSVRLGGEEVAGRPAFRRNVNTVFQQYALFPHMTVYENVAFGLQMKKTERMEVAKRVGEALEMVRLSGYERRRTSQLSGGEQQRVALARALVNRPAILLLDEPLAALDLKLRKEMQSELKELQREVGITFLFVTHDQGEAMALSDTIAVMRQGKIQQVGSAEEIYERPRNRFVADFIGMSNFLEGGMLRPERVRLLPTEEGANASNAIPGVITDATYLGTGIQYQVRVNDHQTFLSLQTNHDASGRFSVGTPVIVTWSPEDLRVLEVEE